MCGQQFLKRRWTLLIYQCIAWEWLASMKAQFLHLAECLLKMLSPGDQMT